MASVKVATDRPTVTTTTRPKVRPLPWWRKPNARKRVGVAYLCLLPWLLGFVVFTAYPIVASAYYSLTDYPILDAPRWIGFDNYRDLFQDDLFWKSLRVTTVYCLAAVPGTVIVGYLIALLLNQKVRLMPLWRTVFFLPSIVPAIAAAYLWSWLLNPELGLVNTALGGLGLPKPGWFGSPDWVLPAFVLMALWSAGGNMILYLAALQQVPTAYYEAAQIDGAGPIRRLLRITLPMTSPVILFTFVTGLIGSFQVFTAGYVLTAGGPNNESLFYVLYLYLKGWRDFQMGYASAMAWILFLLMLVLTLFTILLSRRFVHYEYGGD